MDGPTNQQADRPTKKWLRESRVRATKDPSPLVISYKLRYSWKMRVNKISHCCMILHSYKRLYVRPLISLSVRMSVIPPKQVLHFSSYQKNATADIKFIFQSGSKSRATQLYTPLCRLVGKSFRPSFTHY